VLSAYRVYSEGPAQGRRTTPWDHTALVYLMDRDGRFVSRSTSNGRPRKPRSICSGISELVPAVKGAKRALASGPDWSIRPSNSVTNFRQCQKIACFFPRKIAHSSPQPADRAVDRGCAGGGGIRRHGLGANRAPACGRGGAAGGARLLGPAAAAGPATIWSRLTVIRFLTETDYPPFNFTGPDGNPAGFNVDLARALWRRDQGHLAPSQMRRFETLIDAITSNRGDAIIASMAVTPQLRARVDFQPIPIIARRRRFVSRRDAVMPEVPPRIYRKARRSASSPHLA